MQTFVIRKTLSRRPFQALAHPIFRFAAMVFPAVVEEGDAAIDRFLDNSDRRGDIRRIAEVVAAKTECRNTDIVPAKRLHRDSIVHSLALQWGREGLARNWLDG